MVDLIDEIVKTSKYNTGKRYKRVLTEEVTERIKLYLKENETNWIYIFW